MKTDLSRSAVPNRISTLAQAAVSKLPSACRLARSPSRLARRAHRCLRGRHFRPGRRVSRTKSPIHQPHHLPSSLARSLRPRVCKSHPMHPRRKARPTSSTYPARLAISHRRRRHRLRQLPTITGPALSPHPRPLRVSASPRSGMRIVLTRTTIATTTILAYR